MGNHGGDTGNRCGKLRIAVEMTYCSNGNNKFKDWRKVETIESEYICKNLVSHI